MKVAIYIRVSKRDQTVENQRLALEAFCKSRQLEIVEIFQDGETDHEAAEVSRLGFGNMMKAARQRKFDRIVVWSMDRLSRRGIGPVFSILNQLRSFGVGWESMQESWASSDGPTGDLLLAIMAWVAEQERRHISQRVKAARARKKALKQPWGRKKGSKDKKKRTRRWWKKPAIGTGAQEYPSPPSTGEAKGHKKG